MPDRPNARRMWQSAQDRVRRDARPPNLTSDEYAAAREYVRLRDDPASRMMAAQFLLAQPHQLRITAAAEIIREGDAALASLPDAARQAITDKTDDPAEQADLARQAAAAFHEEPPPEAA